ncbi:hypothetical protein T439DRAFT_191779 [Meredithblackwellia eburnea MCA 4105]
MRISLEGLLRLVFTALLHILSSSHLGPWPSFGRVTLFSIPFYRNFPASHILLLLISLTSLQLYPFYSPFFFNDIHTLLGLSPFACPPFPHCHLNKKKGFSRAI